MLKGHCNCGEVRFEVDARPAGIYMCHCSICRRSTGTNGIAVLVVPNAAFRWLAGESNVVEWTKPGTRWETWFCRTCGSRVPGRNDPERMFVPAGLLDGDAGLEVIHHIWVDSKAGWDVIGDEGKRHLQAFRA